VSHSVYHNVTKSDSILSVSDSLGSKSIAKHLMERTAKFRARPDAFEAIGKLV
jgi:hypothetical protein